MKKENYEFLKSIVKSAVDAAEQKFKGSGRGKEKRAEVIKWIKLRYPKIDENLLDVLIDEMVLGLNKIGKEIDK